MRLHFPTDRLPLVRGLDYYTRTTFEYVAVGLEAAQNAVGGGGRYDGLVAAMGGPDTPGVGFALGIDRILRSRIRPAPGLKRPSGTTPRSKTRSVS